MNAQHLAKALRDKATQITEVADGIDEDADARHEMYDTAELVRVLARVVEGKTIAQAFGAPGDWGYNTPIGAALALGVEGR